MDDARVPRHASPTERMIFGSHGLLALFCLGLIPGHMLSGVGNEITFGTSSLIDPSLRANLVLMSSLPGMKAPPRGMMLTKLASVVAITAIHLHEGFLNVERRSGRDDLAWLVVIHTAFIASAVLLALLGRISGRGR